MGTYLMLSTIGPDGAARLRDNPDRLKQVNADVESMGARVLQQWALLGPYDSRPSSRHPTRRPPPGSNSGSRRGGPSRSSP